MLTPFRTGLPRLRPAALLVSAGLHLLGLGLIHLLVPSAPVQTAFRVRIIAHLPGGLERFTLGPAGSPIPTANHMSPALVEGLLSTAGPGARGAGAGGADDSWLGMDSSLTGSPGMLLPRERGVWLAPEETLRRPHLQIPDQVKRPPSQLDLLELDAERRVRTVAILDPLTRRLRKAYLHIPCRKAVDKNDPRAKEFCDILAFVRRGLRHPGAAPVLEQVHFYRPGYSLKAAEMRQYPILLPKYVDVESTQALARYLVEGGFVIDGFLAALREELRLQVGDRVKQVQIGLDHPLFHSFYDITEYSLPGLLGGIYPIPGLLIDDRLVAVSASFNTRDPYASNKLFVNALVYALIQVGKARGR
jgi:hypothetical protein